MNTKNYPNLIYKYRNWNNKFHKNILIRNEVFMASPSDFNDPFDCRISRNYLLLDNSDKIDLYINKTFEKYHSWILYNGKNIEFEKKSLKKRLENIEEFQKEFEKIEYSEMDQHYGILSLSARWNSILMWSHYGDFHKGFCVGFNEEKMRLSNLFGKGGPVEYSIEYPEINPLEPEDLMLKLFKQTHSKSKEWEYEQEYRLTNLYSNLPKNDERIVKIPSEFIEEVNLGVSISNKNKQDIIQICKNRNIKVYQLHKTPL